MIIPIFFAVDDGYCPFLAVAIQSLIDNSSPENTYLIKVLNTDITEGTRKGFPSTRGIMLILSLLI